jgi:hypothetical protein
MLEEEKVMAITKHKSVQQMRKDYGASTVNFSLRISHTPNTPPRSERLLLEQSTCIRNPDPDVTGNLQPLPGTHIQTYSVFLPFSTLTVTAQPDSRETRPNRETIGSYQVREPPAHGHGEAAASPRTQTSKSTRPVSVQQYTLVTNS